MSAQLEAATRIKFWGVRGSIPTPGAGTVRYGGNTTCVELRADGEIVILDAGSGIRLLGQALRKEFGDQPLNLTLLITHSHWDHIQGLPFFLPAYSSKNRIRVFGYDGTRSRLRECLTGQMQSAFFPVSMAELPGEIDIEELTEPEFHIGQLRVCSKFLNHPGQCVGYRIFTSAGSVAFLPDNEPFERLDEQLRVRGIANNEHNWKAPAVERAELVEFLRETDLVIMDAQYTDEEYPSHIGWGHGSISSAVSLAAEARVKRLVLFHHDPNHDDAIIERLEEQARRQLGELGKSIEVRAAREGHEIILS